MSNLLSVLLIEDDILDAERVQRAFNTVYPPVFSVVHVNRFRDAIQEIKTQAFQVIILDLGLPDSIGLNGVERLMGLVPTVPVIVLTGMEDDESALAGIALGAQEFLNKNEITPQVLIRTIRHAIKRKQVAIEQPSRPTAANSSDSQRLDQIGKLLRQVNVDVTERVGELKKTELTTSQIKLLSDIEAIAQQSGESLNELTNDEGMFVPLKSDSK